ncbi:MAG: hypothetical protein AAF974_00080 [Cyanobacteria bacterium P01_E01_bin.34]
MADVVDKVGASQAAQTSADAQIALIRLIATTIANAHLLAQSVANGIEPLSSYSEEDAPTVRIQVGRNLAYLGKAGQPPVKTNLTPETIQKIRAAIERPESVAGTVRFEVYKNIVYQVQNGQVVEQSIDIDSLREALSQVIDEPEPQRIAPQPVPDAAIPEALERELADLRARVQKLEERLEVVHQKLSSGQLVPISQAIQQRLEQIQLPDLGHFFQRTTETIQTAPSQLGTFFNTTRNQLVEGFSRQTVRMLDTAGQLKDSATASIQQVGDTVKTQAASLAIASLGREAFTRAASMDALQKSVAILKAEGVEQPDGSLKWVNQVYEFQLKGDQLTLSDRGGERGQLLVAQGSRIARSNLQLGDVGHIGEEGMRATEMLVAAQQQDRQLSLSRGR